MKVDLEKIRLAVTAITNNVVATIPNKDGLTMRHKHDVTSDFLKCIIDYGANSKFNIAGGGKGDKEYQVAIIEKKGFKNSLYSRKELIKILADAVKDGIGENVSVDEWIKKNLK